jgi:hypothetical protein
MSWTEQILAAGAVIALLAGLVAWLRRKGWVRSPAAAAGWRGGRCLEPLDRLALAPQHGLHLVRMGDRAILIGRSPTGLTLLDSIEWRPKGPEAAA